MQHLINHHELFFFIKVDGVLMRCSASCHFAGLARVSRVSRQSVPTVPCSTNTSFTVLGGGDRNCVVAGGLRRCGVWRWSPAGWGGSWRETVCGLLAFGHRRSIITHDEKLQKLIFEFKLELVTDPALADSQHHPRPQHCGPSGHSWRIGLSLSIWIWINQRALDF